MRPIKLTICGFGPYAEKEVVDFTKLNGRNIFVVSGKTGAGKTTIFDAISFSLYGEPSGDTREIKSLRSDFSDDDVETFVELEFEIKGEVYKVKRSPLYLKKKKNGEGYTDSKASAELFLPNDKHITKIKDVNDKLIEILGINRQQFKQIVMLAQGEFRKLLLSNSTEREDIFRKIFDTYKFENIQEELKQRARNITNIKKESDIKLKSKLSLLKGIDNDFFDNEYINEVYLLDDIKNIIDKNYIEYKNIYNEKDNLQKIYDKKNKEKLNIENNNLLIKEKETIIHKLEKLKEKKELFDEKEKEIKNIEYAKDIKYLEEKYLEINLKITKYDEEIKLSTMKINNLEKEFDLSKKNLEYEQKNEHIREHLLLEIDRLKKIKSKVFEVNTLEEKLCISKDEYNLLNNKINKIKIDIENLEKKEIENNEILNKINELIINKKDLEKEIENKKDLMNKLRNIIKKIISYEENINSHKSLEKEYNNFELKYKNVKIDYENMEELYQKDKAGILAKTLVNNKPCPVCGSTTHPNKAKTNTIDFDENYLKSKKVELENLEVEKNKKLENLIIKNNDLKNVLENINEDLQSSDLKDIDINKSYDENLKDKIKEIGISLKNECSKKERELFKINTTINKKYDIEKDTIKIKEDLQLNKKNLSKFEENLINIKEVITTNITKIEEFKKDIPNNIKNLKLLDETIIEKENTLKKSREKLDNLKKLYEKIDKDLEKERVLLNTNTNVFKQLKLEEKSSKDKFEYALNSKFNDLLSYEKSKNSIKDLETIKSEVYEYNSNLEILKSKKEDIIGKTKDIEFIELSYLIDEINSILNKKEDLELKEKEAYSTLQNNKSIYEDITKIKDYLKNIENEYEIIGELSDFANGKNSLRLSFERYILASYFEDIIEASNIRLNKITNSRFRLIRKEAKNKNKKQSGLDLLVYDEYTGKEREVSSLSGGESFKASLSLALGLSDVIQSNSGGISIETIFVDEGFGTLDSESLNTAIDCLLELQEGGRLVGIISHVEELKQRIDAKLEIESSQKGSKIKFNV